MHDALTDYIERLCDGGNLTDLAHWREFFQARQRRHPANREVESLAEATAARRCKRQAQKIASRKHKNDAKADAGQLFGD
jgi:hypothetical protein